MTDHYEDIIDLPHHVSEKRTPMPRMSRAAQFAPFAALTGYEDAVIETARLTDEKQELTEEEVACVNKQICMLAEDMTRDYDMRITYFVPDKNKKKKGGRYVTATGRVKDVDIVAACLVMADRTRIPFADIMEIEKVKV